MTGKNVSPDQYRTFLELPGFTRRWVALGLTDADLTALMGEIMATPNAGVVVQGAGGFRKMRFAPPSLDVGKSGAVRVYYAQLVGFGIVLLGSAFVKSEAADLSDQQKATLARLLAAVEQQLEWLRAARQAAARRRKGR